MFSLIYFFRFEFRDVSRQASWPVSLGSLERKSGAIQKRLCRLHQGPQAGVRCGLAAAVANGLATVRVAWINRRFSSRSILRQGASAGLSGGLASRHTAVLAILTRTVPTPRWSRMRRRKAGWATSTRALYKTIGR